MKTGTIYKLDSISIERKKWGELEGKYIATVAISGEKERITMEISPEVSAVVLQACLGEVSAAVEMAADSFRSKLRECVNNLPTIEMKSPCNDTHSNLRSP